MSMRGRARRRSFAIGPLILVLMMLTPFGRQEFLGACTWLGNEIGGSIGHVIQDAFANIAKHATPVVK